MTRIFEKLPKWQHPTVNDTVLDLRAIEQGWPDWKGKVVKDPGSIIKVKYDSGTERWKMDANLISVKVSAFKCAVKRIDSRAYPYSALRLVQTYCENYIVVSEGPGQITTVIFLSKKSFETAKRYLPVQAGHSLVSIVEIMP